MFGRRLDSLPQPPNGLPPLTIGLFDRPKPPAISAGLGDGVTGLARAVVDHAVAGELPICDFCNVTLALVCAAQFGAVGQGDAIGCPALPVAAVHWRRR